MYQVNINQLLYIKRYLPRKKRLFINEIWGVKTHTFSFFKQNDVVFLAKGLPIKGKMGKFKAQTSRLCKITDVIPQELICRKIKLAVHLHQGLCPYIQKSCASKLTALFVNLQKLFYSVLVHVGIIYLHAANSQFFLHRLCNKYKLPLIWKFTSRPWTILSSMCVITMNFYGQLGFLC